MTNKTAPTTIKAASATPIPTPACAPVLKPLDAATPPDGVDEADTLDVPELAAALVTDASDFVGTTVAECDNEDEILLETEDELADATVKLK